MAFKGFPVEALRWLAELELNNDRDWFQAHKREYESHIKGPMLALATSLNGAIAEKMPEYFADQPAKTIFRIYRDTRFSKDKTPYKTHVAAVFHRRGMADKASGLYFQISAKSVGIAGGTYMPPNDSLLAIRTRIAERYEEFQKLLKDRKLRSAMGELQGDALQRPPKGFHADHPAVELLKKKQFYFWTELDPQLATTPKLEKELLSRFLVMRPVALFLDDAVLPLKRKASAAGKFLT